MACPQCGAETQGSEQVCNRCGYTLQTIPDLSLEADRGISDDQTTGGQQAAEILRAHSQQQALDQQQALGQQQAGGQQQTYEQYPQQSYQGPPYPQYPQHSQQPYQGPPYPQYPQQPYQGPPYPHPSSQSGNGTGVGSFVCGIIGVVTDLCCLPFIGLIMGIVAIIMGRKAKNSGAVNGMGSAGFILGIVSLALNILVILFWLMLIFQMASYW